MQYFGGKGRFYEPICSFLSTRVCGRPFVDAFVGGLWITSAMSAPVRIAADANPALIALYRALQSGWIPPDGLDEETYKRLKQAQDSSDPLTAFAGFACSFGGKWFGGYQRSGSRNYALNGKRSLLRQIQRCRDVEFKVSDYRQTIADSPENAVIYLDPPYFGCAPYAAVGPFDSGAFWDIVRQYSSNREIYISEYSAPPDFTCELEIPVRSCVTRGSWSRRTEKVFRWRPA